MKSFGNFVRSKAFEFIFIIFAILSIFYVTNRLDKMLYAILNINFKIFIFIFLIILLGYMFLYIKDRKEYKKSRNLYEICSVIICFLLHLVIALWIFDIIKLLITTINDKYYILPLIIALIITFYGFIHTKKIYFKNYDLKLNNIHNQKIALISDIHVGKFIDFKQLEKIVAKINSLKPDYILIAGDMFDVDAFVYCDKVKIANILKKLKANHDIIAILGNHDPNSKNQAIIDFYKQANIKLLIDDTYDSQDITFIGRDDINTNPNRKVLDELIPHNQKTKIVLDHNPIAINDALDNNIDLIVCGHTHKGQFFPANIFTKLAYGDIYYGYHKKANTNIIVSSGVGYFQMPMRTFSNSEIVIINI